MPYSPDDKPALSDLAAGWRRDLDKVRMEWIDRCNSDNLSFTLTGQHRFSIVDRGNMSQQWARPGALTTAYQAWASAEDKDKHERRHRDLAELGI